MEKDNRSGILFVASTHSHLSQFHRPYMEAFQGCGWRVDAACGGQKMELPEAEQVFSVPFEKSISAPQNWNALLALRSLIVRGHYQVVSCHTALAAFFTRLALYSVRNRPFLVYTAHGYLFGASEEAGSHRLLQMAEGMTAPVTDLLMTMNHWDTQYAQTHGLGKEIVEIPGIGLDPSRLPPLDRERGRRMRANFGVGENELLLLYGAEFSDRKSQWVLLRAMTLLPEYVKLALPGQGIRLQACRELAEELGVAHRVLFPGQVAEMCQWYEAADVALSASRSEGLPFNLMEAMYYGLPIVASRVKGHTDLLENSQAGLLYPYGDWRACADGVQRLLEEPARCAVLGERGKMAVRPYMLDQVLPVVMKHYQSAVSLSRKNGHKNT